MIPCCVGLPIHMFVRDARQGKPETITQIVKAVEDMGFWGVSCAHHFSDPGLSALGHAGGEYVNWRYPDPISILSYLAAVSRKVMLLPWVIVVPYRQPLELAHGLASIDSLSGGRLVFGAGVGSRESEFATIGVPIKERGKITDEWLDIIIELWTNPKATFHGKYHRFEGVNLTLRPVQNPRPPIWIGGGTRAALKRAVRVGDVWAPPGYDFPREGPGPRGWVTAQELKADMAWANEQRKALGKPPLKSAGSGGIPITFTTTPQRGRGFSRKDVTYFTSKGTVEEMTEEFMAFKETGVSYYVVKFTGDTPAEFLRSAEIFANKIMPKL